MKELSASSVRKNFGHYIIRWKIKRFTLATCQESFVLRSPRFQIFASDTTNWKMELETTWDNDDSVLFHLERLNGGPDVIWVNWSVSLTDADVQTCGPIHECECHFERNYRCTVDLESVENVIKLLPPRTQDILIITCHMIVKHETVAKLSNSTVDDGLLSLSHDFQRMFSKGKYYDLVIKVGEKTIRAHKAILSERNVVLGEIISRSAHTKVIRLDWLNAEATESVIAYLYTGNLLYVLDNVSLALYSCIQFLDVKELQQIFYPKEINISSRIRSQNVTFMWLLPDFAAKEKECVSSKILKKTGLDSTWRLHIYPFGTNDFPETICIRAETVASSRCQIVYVEFSLLNRWSTIITKIRMRGLGASGEVICVDNLCSRDILMQAIKNGNLRVTFKIWYSNCDQYSSVSFTQCDQRKRIYINPHYLSLSEAMKSMMSNSEYKDVILEVKGMEILAHKYILAARSKTFSRILCEIKDKIEVDMEDDIFKILINYMYFGFLGYRCYSILAHLYNIADKFCIPALKEDCYIRMQSITS